MTIFVHRPWRAAAVQWTGDNYADVERFVRDHIGDPNNDVGLRNEPWTEELNGRTYSYNTIQFYAWGDDQEVDPGQWIAVGLDVEPQIGSIVSDDEFRIAYQESAP